MTGRRADEGCSFGIGVFSAFNNFTLTLWLAGFTSSYLLLGLLGNSKSFGQCRRFFFCHRQIAPINIRARAQNVGPKLQQHFNQHRASLDVKTFGQRLVIILSVIEPCAVGGISVAAFFGF